MYGNEIKEGFLNNAVLVGVERFSGISVVIAPHPDDESLGCGGTIALLKKAGTKVFIIFVSDGSMSHPSSKKYPSVILSQLRKNEALAAAIVLGIDAADCFFMMLKDDGVPHTGDDGFAEAVLQLDLLIKKLKPQYIFLPFEKDPHKDHQACWQIAHHKLIQKNNISLCYYFIWFWERENVNDEVLQNLHWLKVNIKETIHLKHAAIAAHVSQVSNLIDDDENGFTLSPGMLARFNDEYELFATAK